jgi:hypothetical protein
VKNLGGFSISLDPKKNGLNKPTTPRLVPGLDMDKLDDDNVEPQDRFRMNMPQSTTNKSAAKGMMALISPKAELAKNALAERAKAGKADEEAGADNAGEDTTKQLPEEEYVDFLDTYEEGKWWLQNKKETPKEEPTEKVNKHMATDAISEKSGDDEDKDDPKGDKNLESPKFSDGSRDRDSKNEDDDKDEFPSLDEALEADFNINEISSLKQRFSDVNRQPRKVTDLFPAPL